MNVMERGANVAKVDDSRALNVFGLRVDPLLTGEMTGGAYSTYLIDVGPDQGPVLHRHANDDEAFYIISGRFEVTCGDDVRVASAGTMVFLPRHVPHTFRNVGDDAGKLFGVSTPAGHELFFRDVDALGERALTDVEAAIEVCRRHGLEIIVPQG